MNALEDPTDSSRLLPMQARPTSCCLGMQASAKKAAAPPLLRTTCESGGIRLADARNGRRKRGSLDARDRLLLVVSSFHFRAEPSSLDVA